ncbi:hypothetical protein MBH78_21055 [Oceanimonas sp. NS1]|uniref:Uncharacterized protein n=1 Tax=Oceanimonas doudoroffii TaxID=84158 RepID=A0A233RFI5_9GAMM|nr:MULTISPECIES: hypothetical protein [Oceanimonas]MCT7656444.1 hypothetical protein [Oceanimonas sp. NS1]NHI01640.1 hypothetical protein [Oceanimonas sp. MB9]OXY82139.1 hypothetical protein B6S08_00960 [Oceanimonas doudoroffii]
MMISDLIDQQDFLARLRAWNVSAPARLADCEPLLAELLAGPEGERWRERLNALLAQRALMHPEVLALVEKSLQ